MAKQLPQDEGELWDALTAFDRESQTALFAHCASLTVNAVHEPSNRRPHALAHADYLAKAVNLDMAAAGWTPTIENFLGRVTKAQILQAVREASAAQLISHLKKAEMAERAQELLTGSRWLPEPLRTPGRSVRPESSERESNTDVWPESSSEESASSECETAVVGADPLIENGRVATEPHPVAAE